MHSFHLCYLLFQTVTEKDLLLGLLIFLQVINTFLRIRTTIGFGQWSLLRYLRICFQKKLNTELVPSCKSY